jgi:hypothetical protein
MPHEAATLPKPFRRNRHPWMRELILTRDGSPRPVPGNISLAFERSPQLAGVARCDFLRGQPMICRPPPSRSPGELIGAALPRLNGE